MFIEKIKVKNSRMPIVNRGRLIQQWGLNPLVVKIVETWVEFQGSWCRYSADEFPFINEE